MEWLSAYLPIDRCLAVLRGKPLRDRSHGAALSADVSGFTLLAEALVKELGPKRGAEELTHQLDAIFEALITEVHFYGGSVITFAGDAIMAWFDGDDGRRATACGLAMQQAIGGFAAAPSRKIAMKAAVATGPVRRFVVGDPTFQLLDVLAGATLDRVARASRLALANEVVLAPETAAHLLPDLTVADWRSSAEAGQACAVVTELRAPVETAPWELAGELPEAQQRAWVLPAVYARLRAGQADFLAEFRPALTLFLSFGGIDYDQDDAAGAKLDAYIRWTQGVLNRYEGVLLQIIMGDKGSYFYATFGTPLAHDDDERRALAAALELGAPPPDIGCVRDVRIGLSRGSIWSGAYGCSTRRTYGVLGDSVNLAARLMEWAEAGDILVTQDIADRVSGAYFWEARGPLALKGHKEPVPVSQLLGQRRRIPAILPPSAQPLVGREAEKEALQRLLEQAQRGQGQVVRLEGGVGVGKSHLAAVLALEAGAKGWRVFLGACQSLSQDISYAPWRQVFRAMFELDSPAAEGSDPAALVAEQIAQVEAALINIKPEWRIRLPLLGELVGLPIPDNATTAAFEPRTRQEALFALAVELARAYARQNPTLVLIEDAHWMDEASQGLALALSRAVARLPALLVLVHRPVTRPALPLLAELDRLPHCHTVEISELNPEGVAALLANRLSGPVSATALSLVQTLAQGNPFFAQELADDLLEAGHLVQQASGTWHVAETLLQALRSANFLVKETADGEWRIAPHAQIASVGPGIPNSIHGAVLARLDRLAEPDKITLKVASVIGRQFDLDLLAFAHPTHPSPQAMQAQLQVLERSGLAHMEARLPRPVYRFAHNITQEVLYATLLETQQKALHFAVGQALERLRPEAVEQLAYHFTRSAVRDRALVYLDRAAGKARHSYANETALNYYAQALALEERTAWVQGQVELLHILGRREEELTSLRRLETLADSPAYDVAHLWGQYYEAVSDYVQARAAGARALASAHRENNRLNEAYCLAHLGLIADRQGDFIQAKEWYSQALQLFPEQLGGSDEESSMMVSALNGLGNIHRELGNFDEARKCHEAALLQSWGTGNRKGEAEALNNLGCTAVGQRRFFDALSPFKESMEISRLIGDRVGEGNCLGNLAHVYLMTGDYGQAFASLQEALHIHQSVGNRWNEINILQGLGGLYQELGDLTQAQGYLERGLAISREIEDQNGEANLLSNLSLIAIDRGDWVRASAYLMEGYKLAEAQDDKDLSAAFLSYMATVSWQLGQATAAIRQATVAHEMRLSLGQQAYQVDDLATLAVIALETGDLELAQNYTGQAQALLEELGGEGPEFPHRDYFVIYRVLAAAGQAEPARAALQSALDLVMARADKISAPAMRRSFLENVPINRQIAQTAQTLGLTVSVNPS